MKYGAYVDRRRQRRKMVITLFYLLIKMFQTASGDIAEMKPVFFCLMWMMIACAPLRTY